MELQSEIEFYSENSAVYNCYSFALGSKQNIFGHPGALTGKPLKVLSAASMTESLVSDGLQKVDHKYGALPVPKEGFYLVAAVYAGPTTSGTRDSHLYRQMKDGSWWHKPGKLKPTNIDADGFPIVNPELAVRDYTRGDPNGGNPSRKSGYDNWQVNYNCFAGYFYVPDAGLPVAVGGLPENVMESPRQAEERQRAEWLRNSLNKKEYLPF